LPYAKETDLDQTDVELVTLGLDSLSAINLLLDIEDTFSIAFPDELLNESTFRSNSSLEAVLKTLVEGNV